MAEIELVHPAEPEPGLPAEPEPALLADPEPALPAEPEPVLQAEPDPVLAAEPEPSLPVEPEPALPEEPEPDLPAEPEPALPAEPAQELPSEPEPALPAEPEPDLPAEPEPALPAEPAQELPSEPEPALPAEPTQELPAEPEPGLPAEPAQELPAEPEPALAAEPEPQVIIGENMSEPETELPAEPEPAPPQEPEHALPLELIGLQPELGAEPEPEPEPTLPAEPEPVLPAEPEPALPLELIGLQPELGAEPEPALPLELIGFQPELGVLTDNEYFNICVPLHNAALHGNWEAANKIIEDHPWTSLRKAIAGGGSTVLHVAAGARKGTFVKKLLNLVGQNYVSELLLKRDEQGYNAFCIAAANGHVEIAELMLAKMPVLPNVRDLGDKTPLYLAVLFGQKDMANFLYPLTAESLSPNELEELFLESIKTDLYGITLKLLNHWKDQRRIQLIWGRQAEAQDRNENGTGETALHMLAQKPNLKADALTLVDRLWRSLIDFCSASNQVRDRITHYQNMLFEAAKVGNSEFIAVAVNIYPDLIYKFDENMRSIFHVAVQHRCVSMPDFINKMGLRTDLLAEYKDDDGNNILHLVAKYPNPPPAKIVQGPALELQREILMFEEVERIFPSWYRDRKNGIPRGTEGHSSTATEDGNAVNGYTPREFFTETHKDLRERGETWMKSTATSCIPLAILTATVTFAAAFTVPGGSDPKTAKPYLLHKKFFKVFAVSDAIAMCSSSISMLIFLSILTSRCEEKDFRMQLPFKLMFGLLTLFISAMATTLAFSSSIILFSNEILSGFSVLSFTLIWLAACLNFRRRYPLLKKVIRSTFCSRNQIQTKCFLV